MTSMNQMSSNRATPASANASSTMAGVLPHRPGAAGAGMGVVPKFVPTLTEDEAVSQARLLKALADPTRLRSLSLLSR